MTSQHQPADGDQPDTAQYTVTVDTVREILSRPGSPRYAAVWEVRPGVVRVDVTGWTRAGRRRAQMAVRKAIMSRRLLMGWDVYPIGVSYPRRPWRTWVTVSDPERDREGSPPWCDNCGHDASAHQATGCTHDGCACRWTNEPADPDDLAGGQA